MEYQNDEEDSISNSTDRPDRSQCLPESMYTAAAIVTFILAFAGFTGNGLTIVAILTSRLRQNSNCILIGHLSLVVVMYATLVLPLQAIAFYRRAWSLPYVLCQLQAAIRTWLIGANVTLQSAIAIFRLINVAYPVYYPKLSHRNIFLPAVIFCWFLPFSLSMTPLMGVWGFYGFQQKELQCTFGALLYHVNSHKTVVITSGYIIPIVVIMACYARIGCVVYQARRRVLSGGSSTRQDPNLRLTLTMLFIFLAFFCGTTPYFIVNMVDPKQTNVAAHIWAPSAAWVLYCLNPIIYTVMDKNFHDAYLNLLYCCFFRDSGKRVGSEEKRSVK